VTALLETSIDHGEDTLKLFRVVLVDTSHPGNIGSAARAMKTMGLSHLVLVNPRDPMAHLSNEAKALATGAADLLDAALVVPDLDAGLAGSRFAVAMSARQRDLSPPQLPLPDAAAQCVGHAARGDQVAFVFGSERYGLSNQDVMRCQALTSIQTSAHYSSLNLSQAVQLACYECLRAATAGAKTRTTEEQPLANAEDRERLFVHLEQALVGIGFIDPEQPTRLMQRLRRLFARTSLEAEEVAILRGICTQMLLAAGR
jgi:tRNA/rRNA methyltransferase